MRGLQFLIYDAVIETENIEVNLCRAYKHAGKTKNPGVFFSPVPERDKEHHHQQCNDAFRRSLCLRWELLDAGSLNSENGSTW